MAAEQTAVDVRAIELSSPNAWRRGTSAKPTMKPWHFAHLGGEGGRGDAIFAPRSILAFCSQLGCPDPTLASRFRCQLTNKLLVGHDPTLVGHIAKLDET